MPETDPRSIGLAAGAIVTLGLLAIAWRLVVSQSNTADFGSPLNSVALSGRLVRSPNAITSSTESDVPTTSRSTAFAQPIPVPKSVIDSIGIDAFERLGADQFTSQQLQMVGPGFQRVLQAKTQKTSETDELHSQFSAKNRIEIKQGDLLQAKFYARCDSTHCKSEFVFESNSTGQRAITHPFAPGRSWLKCTIAFMADKDVAPGEGRALLRLSYAEQTIQFGGIDIVDYGPGQSIEQLAATACDEAGVSD